MESTCGQASGLRLSISLSNDSETLVGVAGVEPARAGEGTPADISMSLKDVMIGFAENAEY